MSPWGKSVSIDLHECPHDRVNNKELLEKYIQDVLVKIKMKAHGPTYIDRFGDPELHLEGYSAMQFIETSSITVHLDEVNDRAFIDIFSCQDFDADSAALFTKEFFGAKQEKHTTLER